MYVTLREWDIKKETKKKRILWCFRLFWLYLIKVPLSFIISFFFNPSVILNPKSAVAVHVTAKFGCSTSFTPLKEEICAEVLVDDKKLWNTLCGLKMQTELTPLLSVDDISLRKEIGRGSYDYSIETYRNSNSLFFLFFYYFVKTL